MFLLLDGYSIQDFQFHHWEALCHMLKCDHKILLVKTHWHELGDSSWFFSSYSTFCTLLSFLQPFALVSLGSQIRRPCGSALPPRSSSPPSFAHLRMSQPHRTQEVALLQEHLLCFIRWFGALFYTLHLTISSSHRLLWLPIDLSVTPTTMQATGKQVQFWMGHFVSEYLVPSLACIRESKPNVDYMIEWDRVYST